MTPPEGISDVDQTKRDEQRLAELGYKQELSRTWSAFTNFAISFTIISVLAGCFTAFGFAWLNGGPIAVSIGWPVLCLLIFCVAFSMSELTSAYPTAGGPYWWAHDLGGKGWSWMTGWFNIAGLLGIVASVAYGAAIFLNILLGLYGLNILGINFGDTNHVLGEQFLLFLIILLGYTRGEHLRRPLPGPDQQHLGRLAPARRRGDHRDPLDRARQPPEREVRLHGEVQRVRLLRRLDRQLRLLVLRPADRVPADDVHGDRLRRLRPHRGGDPGRRDRRRPGRLAVGVLLGDHRLDPAALVPVRGHQRQRAIDDGAGYSTFIFTSALDSWAAKLVILIATVGQLFCGAAGLTSASRTWYAFSRDRAIPGWNLCRRVNRDRVPFNAVIGVSFFSLVISIPALFGKNDVPFAFYALTGICTVGLYVAYIIPVYLRLRAGDSFKPGPWTLGARYRWVNTIGIFFVILVVFALNLPYTPAGLPWNDGFDASLVNYTPWRYSCP